MRNMWVVTVCVLTVLAGFVTPQKTFVSTCECEYVTNGKCAYTILLPIGEQAAAATCDSGKETPKIDSGDMGWIQSELSSLQMNVSYLRDWSGSQSKMLAQLQSAIIRIQTTGPMDMGSGEDDPITTTTPKSTSGSSPQDLTDITAQVNNLGSNMEALRVGQASAARDISSLNVILTDTVQRVRAIQEEMPKLRTKVTDYEGIMGSMYAEITALKSRLCESRGLLVSGPSAGIPDEAISASSSFDENHGPVKGRMNNTAAPGAWCPKEPNEDYEWLQFDLGTDQLLFGTASKGRYDFQQWVTSYSVEYAVAAEADVWNPVVDIMGDKQIFPGNTDRNSPQVNLFWTPVKAAKIRIIPIGVTNNNNKCMRADVIGCLDVMS